MANLKYTTKWIAALALLVFSGSALAQGHQHGGHGVGASHMAVDAMTAGEIRKVDAVQGKLTIRHEEIKSITMPPMTMVFVVQDPKQMQDLKVGDKVMFQVVDQAGRLVITKINKAS